MFTTLRTLLIEHLRKFRELGSKDLVTPITPRVELGSYAAVILLFAISHKYYVNTRCTLFDDLLFEIIDYTKSCGTKVTATSAVRSSAILLLLIIGN